MIDSRELSFDDLSAPLAEAAPLGGAGPFVINLGASSAPLELPAEDLTGGTQAYVYRIRRTEDGRIRYRLRLGPFAREEDADAALSRVRNVYPSALTATAWVEDLNAIAVQQAKAGISRPILEGAPKLRSIRRTMCAGDCRRRTGCDPHRLLSCVPRSNRAVPVEGDLPVRKLFLPRPSSRTSRSPWVVNRSTWRMASPRSKRWH
jgi:hypothetical protein